jgi:sugar phosphate isomerase/epimerase
MIQSPDRRHFIKGLGLLAGTAGLGALLPLDGFGQTNSQGFQISLAEWSLHRALMAKEMTNLDFPLMAKKDFDIHIVEYVSIFFDKKEEDPAYLKELKSRTDTEGIQNHLIMVDREGQLGDPDDKARLKAVENHYKWVHAAKFLGCKTIRVNAASNATETQAHAAAVDGLGRLTEYGASHEINIIVENHGGYSSDANWLTGVIKQVNSPFCGTLPDLGNFKISAEKMYDKYLGVSQLMPYAKGVSAKSYDFAADGSEKTIDYDRMFKIIKQSKFKGIVGIEYEGSVLSEPEGIRKTKKLLEKIRKQY